MTSYSFVPGLSTQDQEQQIIQQQKRAAYLIGGSTMKLQERELRIQVENPVDFKSLSYHGCNIEKFYETQGWMDYFKMLNGPAYKALVRHFWVGASIYNKQAAEDE
jgi:hypothetical protein